MINYDHSLFNPPAPVATVKLRNPTTGITLIDVPLLIDSGVDATLLPQNVVDQLGVTALADLSYELLGFDGAKSLAQAAKLELLFLGKTFRGQFLLIDQDYGILGRNILNLFTLVLNGPALTWSASHFKVN